MSESHGWDFGKGINSFKKGLNDSKDDPKVINADDPLKAINTDRGDGLNAKKDTVER